MGKIYVTRPHLNSISIIDGSNDSKIKDISVGKLPGHPISVAASLFPPLNKIYVPNFYRSVSVINSTPFSDNRTKSDISVGSFLTPSPPHSEIVDVGHNKIYVLKSVQNVSVINTMSGTREPDVKIDWPIAAAVRYTDFGTFPRPAINQIYILHSLGPGIVGQGFVSVINATTDKKEPYDIPVGKFASDIVATKTYTPKLYVANQLSNTTSVINTATYKKHDIAVGSYPEKVAYDPATDMIYVVNIGTSSLGGEGTVSVIDGATDNVTAGVIFNVNPINSGKIRCHNAIYPTNTYLYVDAGTNCTAEPNKDFGFNTWVESPLTNRNSSIPLESTGNLTVNRYGVFTVNFKPLPPPIPPDISFLIITVVVTTMVGWSVPSIFGWVKATAQRKLDKNTIEDKVKGYYVHGKISEEHHQFLKDRISEYYEQEKGSERYGAPFT